MGGTGYEDAGVRGAAPVGSKDKAPMGGSGGGAPRLTRNELKMFHKQILSRNKAWRVSVYIQYYLPALTIFLDE